MLSYYLASYLVPTCLLLVYSKKPHLHRINPWNVFLMQRHVSLPYKTVSLTTSVLALFESLLLFRLYMIPDFHQFPHPTYRSLLLIFTRHLKLSVCSILCSFMSTLCRLTIATGTLHKIKLTIICSNEFKIKCPISSNYMNKICRNDSFKT